MNVNLILDFDSTFITTEALSVLADLALEGNKDKDKILAEIKNLTDRAMEGEIGFYESLKTRFSLIHVDKQLINKAADKLKNLITPSILRHKNFISKNKDKIYIISGGFLDFILPVVKPFGLDESHILANRFHYDYKGKVVGFDENNPLAKEDGKPIVVERLGLKEDIIVVGDGMTDVEIKTKGKASKFIALTENISRKKVLDAADYCAKNFDEILSYLNLELPKIKPIKFLLLEGIHQKAIQGFSEEGFVVEAKGTSLTEDELVEAIKDVTFLGIRSKTKITKRVIDAANDLVAIGAFGIGTNQIDLEYCVDNAIAVFNAPFSNTRSVVELVVGQLIMLFRKVTEKSAKLHRGQWFKSTAHSHEVRGKNLGIVGYGNIGSQLSILAEALGMHVYFYDAIERMPLGNAVKCNSLEELLKVSDAISLHVAGSPENVNLINKDTIALMRDNAILINLSRGNVINFEDLKSALETGKIRGAGIDVYPNEPKSNDEQFNCILQGFDNVILTPHIGGSTLEAQADIGRFVSEKVIDYVQRGTTLSSVNFPNIKLPPINGSHRIIHIHKNKPGILAKLNGYFAEHNINIAGQYLNTNQQIGYVITDIDATNVDDLTNILKEIPNTLKVRVLY